MFEGTSFEAGYVYIVQRQIWVAITGEREFKMAKIYEKWEVMEEANKPNIVIGFPRFRG